MRLIFVHGGDKILVLEYDNAPFQRATYINQARVHMGYHYPRSYSTAIASAHYFNRFNEDYGFCIHSSFDQIYATSANFSWTGAAQFQVFCKNAAIRCDRIAPERYFNEGMCDGAFLTTEYTYDAAILRDHFLRELEKYPKVELKFGIRIGKILQEQNCFRVILQDGAEYSSDFLLNASYASINQVLARIEGGDSPYPPIKIKYELCEIILCDAGEKLQSAGITVMDGPFFSIMPFGKTGMHTLTSVTFTPHKTSYEVLPTFYCQKHTAPGYCGAAQLGNCNDCPAKPESAWPYMSQLAKKYLRADYGFTYRRSLFSMKPILQTSEIDDSRPTVIRRLHKNPTLISVLSGKINTVYDLDEVLRNGGR